MKTVNDLLKDADPLRVEAPVDALARSRIRRTVMEAARSAPAVPARRAFARLGMIAAAVAVVAVAAGSKTWLGRSTTLQAAVRFEVRLAETEPAPGLSAARIAGSNAVVYLHQEPVLTNDDIAAARVVRRADGSGFDVSVTFTAAGGEKMRQATSAHMERPLAILIDGEVVVAPTVRAVITSQALITGRFSEAEAGRIATGMIPR